MLGKDYKDAAWYYASPLEKATNIKDHVAFCKSIHCAARGVVISLTTSNRQEQGQD